MLFARHRYICSVKETTKFLLLNGISLLRRRLLEKPPSHNWTNRVIFTRWRQSRVVAGTDPHTYRARCHRALLLASSSRDEADVDLGIAGRNIVAVNLVETRIVKLQPVCARPIRFPKALRC
jgi:hypothetical protein